MALAIIIAAYGSDLAPPTRSSCDMLILGDADIVLYNDNHIACDNAMREPYLLNSCSCKFSQPTLPLKADTLTKMTVSVPPIDEAILDAARLIWKPKTPHISTRSTAGVVLLQHTPASLATHCSTALQPLLDTSMRLSMMDRSCLVSSNAVCSISRTTHGSIETTVALVLQFDSVQPACATTIGDSAPPLRNALCIMRRPIEAHQFAQGYDACSGAALDRRQQLEQSYPSSILAKPPSPLQSYYLDFDATPAPPLHKLGISSGIGFTFSMVVAPSQATNPCDHSLNHTTLNAYPCDLSHCSYQFLSQTFISMMFFKGF